MNLIWKSLKRIDDNFYKIIYSDSNSILMTTAIDYVENYWKIDLDPL